MVDALQLGELGTVVDAQRLLRRGGHAVDWQSTRHRQGDDIGQVVLALIVVRSKRADEIPQHRLGRRQDAGIDLREGLLYGGSVPFLDDSGDVSVAIAQDSPETERIVHFGAGQGEAVAGSLDAAHDRGRGREWRIAEQDEDRRVVRDRGQRLADGVARTLAGFLQRPGQARIVREARLDPLALLAHHDVDSTRFKGSHRVQNMGQQWATTQRMQYLGHRRAHPRAGTRRQYHYLYAHP